MKCKKIFDGRQLPRNKRADIEAELRSALTDSLEARSQGEPTQDQVVAVLKEFGRPEKVAASYWPEGQYLIGPRLFPLFRMVVGIALTVFVVGNQQERSIEKNLLRLGH